MPMTEREKQNAKFRERRLKKQMGGKDDRAGGTRASDHERPSGTGGSIGGVSGGGRGDLADRGRIRGVPVDSGGAASGEAGGSRDVLIPAVPLELLDRIEAWRAAKGHRSRTAAIRALLERGLGK